MKVIYTLTLVFLSLLSWGQTDRFTLASYNSLRYSPNNIDARHPDLRLIMNDLQPDILCLQELSGTSSASMYLDSVLNMDSTTYSLATFIDGNGLDIALYYKTTKFGFIATSTYPTALRDIYHFQLIPMGTPDTLHIFGVHLKASTGSSNQQARKSEVDVLRQITDQFKPGTYFLVCGDFNIYGANEPAYTRLIQDTPSDEGHVVDPLSLSGTWNNQAYAIHHTQSPRTTQFNGGANGGMDDRFDMILVSEALNDITNGLYYIPGSVYAYGNDGLHYNNAINAAPTNTAVGQVLADALHYASDHIPVVARFGCTKSSIEVDTYTHLNIEISVVPSGVYVYNPKGEEVVVSLYTLDGRMYRERTISQSETILVRDGLTIVSVASVTGSSHISKLVYQ